MRIFWLGMHQVLVNTELPRLRTLGYEVFNPPYLSEVVDQSAKIEWHAHSDCTLPAEVAEKIAKYNFFYNEISPEIADLLNTWFDAIIVTINPDWLVNILKVYHGKVIYRVFGQPYSLSEHFQHHDRIQLICEHDNFFFVPHHQLNLMMEHAWLRERMEVVPYCLPNDVFDFRDTWSPSREKPQIGLLCPRIDNPYYSANYKHLKHYFVGESYPIFGKQIVETDDAQIVGSISRIELLQKFRSLSGFYYHFTEASVAYLPPLEFMTIGGPVLAKKGSLLARFFDTGVPNVVDDDVQAHDLVERLMNHDKVLAAEMIAAQENVRQLYAPEYVWPIFDDTFKRLLDTQSSPAGTKIFGSRLGDIPKQLKVESAPVKQTRVVVLFHRFGGFITFQNGNYSCSEGVAKVARVIIKALASEPRHINEIIVTCYRGHLQHVHGYFRSVMDDDEIVLRCLVVDNPPLISKLKAFVKKSELARRVFGQRLSANIPQASPASTSVHTIQARFSRLLRLGAAHGKQFIKHRGKIVFNKMHRINFSLKYNYKYHWLPQQKEYVRILNQVPDIEAILIPHYYLFPEAKELMARKILYLPDHMPYIMGKGTFPDEELNNRIGRSLVKVSDQVLTNSRYSADYLGECPLSVPKDKIVVFPLPNLVLSDASMSTSESSPLLLDEFDLKRHRYVFYPTQNRPNKRLSFLIEVINRYNETYALGDGQCNETLDLVLTCPPSADLIDLARSTKLSFAVNRQDSDIRSFYSDAFCLCFTSVLEGNFPTQVKEALIYRTPVVATELPLITRELLNLSDLLCLCKSDRIDGFIEAIKAIRQDRDVVLQKQEKVREFLIENHSMEVFERNVKKLLRQRSL